MWRAIATAALIGSICGSMGACHHESTATSTTASTWDRAKDDFGAAFDNIKAGTSKTATAGKYALADVGSGVVRVTDRSKTAVERAGGNVSDAWITTKVKTELARTPGVESGKVHVTTDRRIVRLVGTVPDAQAAERAIDRAMDVKGVDAVDADLTYPTRWQRTQEFSDSPKQ